MIFDTPGRVYVEPPSVADSLRECTTVSPQALQGTADADVVDDLEDEVVAVFFRVVRRRIVKIFSPSCPLRGARAVLVADADCR
jgi:hypothetical protein